MKQGNRGILAFGLVGAIGFTVDGGVLTLLSQTFGINIYLSRVFSFSVATLVTWLFNRTMVFAHGAARTRNKRHEYGKYLLVQTGGALLNLGVFSALIKSFPRLETMPIVPLAAGAAFGLVFNYSGARYWVFKRD
jgi:putative flippase GtrA